MHGGYRCLNSVWADLWSLRAIGDVCGEVVVVAEWIVCGLRIDMGGECSGSFGLCLGFVEDSGCFGLRSSVAGGSRVFEPVRSCT